MQYTGDLHALVIIQRMFEQCTRSRVTVEHQVPADETAGIREPVRVCIARRIQEQPRRLGAIPGHDHSARFLRTFVAVRVVIENLVHPTLSIRLDAEHRALCANLAVTACLSQRNHRGQGG